jgi:four helix bundle protein
MKVKSYKELNVWKKGIEIVNRIYEITERFPHKENYGLSSQMQRAAVSGHTAEYRQYLRVALGSCAELDTQLVIVGERGYTSQTEILSIQNELEYESRMITNLIKSLVQNVKP